MKLLTSLFVLLLTANAYASGVSQCEPDSNELENINEDKANKDYLVVDIKNSKGELVGAITVYATGPRKMGMAALNLCGDNNGYYYASGNLLEDLDQKVGESKLFGSFYSDEYDSNSSATVLSRQKDTIRAQIEIKIFYKGEAEDADHETFTTNDLFIEVKVK